MSLNPYDITKLAVGPIRVLYAPVSVAVPVKLQDIIDLTSPYAAAGEWVDFGAAPEGEGSSYSRGFETEEIGIEQTTSAVFTEITDVNRSFTIPIAEIDPTNIKVVEGTDVASEAVEAAKDTSAQTVVPLGTVAELPEYRVALIARRPKKSGIVKEPGESALERGRLVAVVLDRCTLAADDSEIEGSRGSLLSAPITFEAFPETEQEDPEKQHGRWIFEAAGTIPAE